MKWDKVQKATICRPKADFCFSLLYFPSSQFRILNDLQPLYSTRILFTVVFACVLQDLIISELSFLIFWSEHLWTRTQRFNAIKQRNMLLLERQVFLKRWYSQTNIVFWYMKNISCCNLRNCNDILNILGKSIRKKFMSKVHILGIAVTWNGLVSGCSTWILCRFLLRHFIWIWIKVSFHELI